MDIVEELRQNRDIGAKRLVSEYKAGLMSLARRFCVNESDAEELVNATFAKVVDNIDDYLEQSAFFAWMCQILTNLFRESVRRKSNKNEIFPGEVPDVADEDAQEEIFRNLDHSFLRDAIRELPADQRELLLLHYFMDMPVAKIAKFLSIPSGTVFSRLHYARKALGAKLVAAAKKPGGKALLVALALCGLTALGAAVALVGDAAFSRVKRDEPARRAEALAWTGEGTSEAGGTGEGTGETGTGPASPARPASLSVPDLSTPPTTQKTPSTHEKQNMNATALRTFVASAAIAAATGAPLTAGAYTTSITDTTGYVVQNAADGYNENSIISGTHFPGGAPVAGKHYLVNNGLNTRTPPNANQSNIFRGDSFTLDGGANFLLKGAGSTITIGNLIIHNALISQGDGNSSKTLAGSMTVKGTALAPSIIQGSGDSGTRRLLVNSAISGASDALIKVQRTASDGADVAGAQFYLHFKGDNSGYAGAIEVEGGGNGVCLVGYGNSSLGSSPNVTLSNNGRLLGGGDGGSTTLSGAAITLDGGGTLGVYKNGSSSQGLILSGGTISGSGMLTINNSDAEGTHDRRVVLGNVAISGIDGIVVQGGVLQFAPGYSNPTTPITMAQSKMLRTAEGISAGPVTLQAKSFMNLSGESVTLASLTFDQTDDTPPYIIKLLRAGCITVTGDITNRLVSGQKMRIDFNDNLDSIRNQFKTVKSFRILSAANLGEPGVTADDFVATSSAYDATGYVAAFVTNGTFSIETDGATKYLVYTLDRNAVVSTGTDVAGQCSFMANTHWSDSATPHDTADYFILGGHEIRTKEKTTSTFGGHSLSVLSGGSLALVGNASGIKSTVGDLRLYGGAILTAKRNWGNYLDGNITVNGTAATPVVFQTEWASMGEGDTTTARTLHVSAAVSGGGSIRCQYQGP